MIVPASDFQNQPYKSITLMGMSGSGKSYLTAILEQEGWSSYPCDTLLGERYLREDIQACGADKHPSLSPINAYVGQLGDPARGGIPLKEFKRRQALHYEGECAAMADMVIAAKAHNEGHFVHDSSGSLCEIHDETLMEAVGQSSLLVYLQMGKEDEAELIRRAIAFPKSLYYPADKFDLWLQEYLETVGFGDPDRINPPEFVRWVFPRLFASRLPKYERLAQKYGVVVPTAHLQSVTNATSFLDAVHQALLDRVA